MSALASMHRTLTWAGTEGAPISTVGALLLGVLAGCVLWLAENRRHRAQPPD